MPAPTFNPSQSGTTLWRNVAMPTSMMECWPEVAPPQEEQASDGFQKTDLFVEKG